MRLAGTGSHRRSQDAPRFNSRRTLLAEQFSLGNGCPTKELYSMAGLANFSMTGLADFFGWNALEAADA